VGDPLLGAARITVGQAQDWARGHGATTEFVGLAPLYFEIGPLRGGVRPEVGYAQAAWETGYGRFGGIIDASYKNPCGMKTRQGGSDTDPAAHQRFPDWRTGVTAHLDHIAVYAGAAGYPRPDTPDPRHTLVTPGSATTVEQMGAKWATAGYGERLAGLVREMTSVAPGPQPQPSPSIRFVSRAAWRARPAKGHPTNVDPSRGGWAIHYSDAAAMSDHARCDDQVRGIQDYHMDSQGWLDIAYSFLVCDHGFVFEGRGWGVRTAANGSDDCNDRFLAICYLTNGPTTKEGRTAMALLVGEGRRAHGVGQEVRPHSACVSTSCPGDELRKWIADGGYNDVPLPPPPEPEPDEEEDMYQLVSIKGSGQSYLCNGSTLLLVKPDADDAGSGWKAIGEFFGITAAEAKERFPLRYLTADHFVWKLPKVQ
jgi:hypothetical protein